MVEKKRETEQLAVLWPSSPSAASLFLAQCKQKMDMEKGRSRNFIPSNEFAKEWLFPLAHKCPRIAAPSSPTLSPSAGSSNVSYSPPPQCFASVPSPRTCPCQLPSLHKQMPK
ncbi:hypothetical protein niasHT_003731 [Heterodera trifolii]|uniref:Uncharacterized protein n=1 Tax=Heterodera trifolii TaxID=157864 RepID=A0ABD2LV26_9BILA